MFFYVCMCIQMANAINKKFSIQMNYVHQLRVTFNEII